MPSQHVYVPKYRSTYRVLKYLTARCAIWFRTTMLDEYQQRYSSRDNIARCGSPLTTGHDAVREAVRDCLHIVGDR